MEEECIEVGTWSTWRMVSLGDHTRLPHEPALQSTDPWPLCVAVIITMTVDMADDRCSATRSRRTSRRKTCPMAIHYGVADGSTSLYRSCITSEQIAQARTDNSWFAPAEPVQPEQLITGTSRRCHELTNRSRMFSRYV